jgi:hypothetical protein
MKWRQKNIQINVRERKTDRHRNAKNWVHIWKTFTNMYNALRQKITYCTVNHLVISVLFFIFDFKIHSNRFFYKLVQNLFDNFDKGYTRAEIGKT